MKEGGPEFQYWQWWKLQAWNYASTLENYIIEILSMDASTS